MSTGQIVTATLGPVVVAATSGWGTWLTYRSATRARREQETRAQVAVTAEAYDQAREIYQSSISQLKIRVAELEATIAKLRRLLVRHDIDPDVIPPP